MWSSCWDVSGLKLQFVMAADGDTCISHMLPNIKGTTSQLLLLLLPSGPFQQKLSAHFSFQQSETLIKIMIMTKGMERNKPSIAKQRPLSFSSELGGIHNKGMSRAPRPNANNFALSSLGAIHRLAQLAAHVEEEEAARVALPER